MAVGPVVDTDEPCHQDPPLAAASRRTEETLLEVTTIGIVVGVILIVVGAIIGVVGIIAVLVSIVRVTATTL